MTWIRILYNVLFAAVVLDALASAFAAAYIFRLRERFGKYLAMAFAGIAIEAVATAITAGVGTAPSRASAVAVTLRILAQFFKTATMGALTLYLLGYLNGGKPVVKNDPK